MIKKSFYMHFYSHVNKILPVFLFVLSAILFVACSKKDSGSDPENEYGYLFNESFSTGERMLVAEAAGNRYGTACICVRNDKLYYATQGEYDDSEGMYNTYVNMCDLSDGESAELFQIHVDDGIEAERDGEYKSVTVEGVGADDGGNISVVTGSSVTDVDGKKLKYSLKKYTYTADGQMQDSCDIDVDKNELLGERFIKSCRLSSRGDIYILYGTFEGDETPYSGTLYRFNPDGSNASVCEFQGTNVSDVVLDANDRPIVTYTKSPEAADYHTSAMYIDMEKGLRGSQGQELDGIVNGADGIYRIYSLYAGGSAGSLLVNDGKTLSAYDGSAGTESKICNWMDSGLLGSHVIYACMCKNGNIFCLYADGDSTFGDLDNIRAGFMEKTELSDDDRPVIQVMDPYGSDATQQDIIRLNRSNDKYRVEYISFEQYENGEEKMKYEIIAGHVPDVIMLGMSTDLNNFIAKGYLEDLSPYIKEDDTVNADYFLDGFLDAISTDGKNYFLSGSFNIDALVGRKSDLSGFGDGWSVDEFIDYYKSKPKGTKLFPNMTKQGLCFSLLGYNLSKFIDWKEGKCSFDGDEFRKLLEFCAGFENGDMFGEDENEMDKHVKLIKEGSLLMERAHIRSSLEVTLYRMVFDGDGMFIGYPSDEDGGIYMNTFGGIGMMSSSGHKEEAWDYIKRYITDENADTNSTKEGFEKTFAEDSVSPGGGMTMYNGLVIEPAKKEDADMVKELVKKAKLNPYSYDLYEIIQGDTEGYFAGEKGLDETVNIIQDRMEKYVNENR